MRIPGVSVFCVAASLLVAQSPHPDLSGKRRIDRSKCKKACDMKRGSADHQSSEAKDLVVFDILRESKCVDCGKELLGGDFLFMEGRTTALPHMCRSRSFGLPAQRRHRSDPTCSEAQRTFRRGGSL